MGNGYVPLIEKEEMWARMLMEVLEDHLIPCTAVPVYGAGFSLKTGARERLTVFVPRETLPRASELVEALFEAEWVDFDTSEQ